MELQETKSRRAAGPSGVANDLLNVPAGWVSRRMKEKSFGWRTMT